MRFFFSALFIFVSACEPAFANTPPGPSGGISALTGDVTASGVGSVSSTVTQIQGIPVASGTPGDGQILIFNASSTQWVPGALPATGLNADMSNMSSPTLMNADLVWDASTPAKLRTPDVSSGNSFELIIKSGDVTGGSGNSAHVVYTAGSVISGNGQAGPVDIRGANADGASTGGDIFITPGLNTAAVPGKIYINQAGEGTSGDCLVSYGTSGEAHWDTCPGDGGSYVKTDGSTGLSADWNAGAHTITATTFSGNATTATDASQAAGLLIGNDTTTNSTMYPTWIAGTSGYSQQYVSSTKLTFNPSTGTLAATAFSGPLTGNVTGNVSGSSGSTTGNAATATALAANPSDCSSDTYATAIDASGNLSCAAVTDAGLAVSYVKADGSRGLSADWNAGAHSITATTFVGALTGNASTATTATNATNTGITDDTTTNATMYPSWVTTTTGNLPQKVSSSKLTFNPSSGTLSSTTFVGALTGNASTATAATTATITNDNATNSTVFPVWTLVASGNNALTISSSKLTFNPSTGMLTATGLTGPLTGTASGNATLTASNHGMIFSGSGNTLTVLAPDSSTTKFLKSGGSSADPSWTDKVSPKEVLETVVAGGTCSTTYTVDPTTGSMFNVTLNGACSLAVTNLAAGHSFTIKLTQSATTAPTFTSAYKWTTATTPTFSTSATKYDMIACVSLDGTTLDCNALIDVR